MTKQHFSFQEVFKFGWAKTKQHAWFLVLTFFIISIITNAVRMVPFVDAAVSIMACLSVASIALQISRDQHFTFRDLYMPLLSQRRVLKFIVLTALYVFAVLVGTALLIVPGIYIMVRFKFFPFVVVDHENTSIQDLVKMTYALTAHNFWSVFFFVILACLLNFVGFICFVVGLFITIPTTLFAAAHMYNRLKQHTV
jgi:uncharacterized membrane protein